MEEFSKRLHYALLKKGWSQSDLARAIDGTFKVDSRGFKQWGSRDRISSYINKKAMPEPRTLTKIAKALDMDAADLAPNLTAAAVENESPALELKMVAGHRDKCLLRINQLVPMSVAVRVLALIEGEE
jgi:hypothetical protein